MLLSPLTYTVHKTPDQLQPFLESALQPGNPYSMLLTRHTVQIKQNRAGGFYLTTPVQYIEYRMKLTPDESGDTIVSLKPEMRTFFKVTVLMGFLVCLTMVFFIFPLLMGQTIPLFDVLVVVMFPVAYFGNTLIGHKQTCAVVDAFMKEYISAIAGK